MLFEDLFYPGNPARRQQVSDVFAVTEPPCFYLDGGETQKGEWKNNGLYERFPPRFSYVKPSPL